MKLSTGCTLFFLFFSSPHSHAENKIKLGPNYTIDANPPDKSVNDLRYTVEEKEGVLYKKFSSASGDLYVLDSQVLSTASIRSGQCFAGDQRNNPQSVAIVKEETGLSGAEIKAFAGIIQDTVRDKCNNFQVAQKKLPSLDIGISKQITDKQGVTKEYKIFNTNLQPNLNFSGQF